MAMSNLPIFLYFHPLYNFKFPGGHVIFVYLSSFQLFSILSGPLVAMSNLLVFISVLCIISGLQVAHLYRQGLNPAATIQHLSLLRHYVKSSVTEFCRALIQIRKMTIMILNPRNLVPSSRYLKKIMIMISLEQ